MSVVSGVMGANATDKAAKTSAKASDRATQAELDMYNKSREDFSTFLEPAGRAMATLQSGTYGGPQTYVDSKGVTQTADYKPTESEGFKYTKARTLDDLGRSLRMMGRGSGTVAANATGRTLGDLTANNEASYKNDLLNLVKTGQGAAGSTSALGQNTASSLANIYQNQGNNAAQFAMNKASIYSGMGAQGMNAVGTGMRMYNMNKGNGNGQLYNEAGGDINKVDFGEGW